MPMRRFEVSGRFRKTGEEGAVEVQARSRDDAQSEAEQMGLEVEALRAVATVRPSDPDAFAGPEVAIGVLRVISMLLTVGGALGALLMMFDSQPGWVLVWLGVSWNGFLGYIFSGVAAAVFDLARSVNS